MKRRALLSVSDKTGLVPFARTLAELGFEIISTGGTFKVLSEADVPVRYVTEITDFPEVFGGRVKTLHPVVHGGILHRRDLPDHVEQAADLGIVPIDIVAVNLYPFVKTVARPDVSFDDAIENIDIGGPAMVRAAAKNHASVTVVVSPADYDLVSAELTESGEVSVATRRSLALAAYRHTATYDAAIATWLATRIEDEASTLPAEIHRPLIKVDDMRYGENPHQAAALYRQADAPAFGGAEILQGKAVSYNNIVDLDGAVGLSLEFEEPAVVVVKHTNPCGVGRDTASIHKAWERALAADPVSAFGGIVASNRPVDGVFATELAKLFLEVVAAPSFTDEARAILAAKTNLRLVALPVGLHISSVSRDTLFGTVVQTADPLINGLEESWSVVTDRAPSADEDAALRFLWRVCKHVKSNAIVIGDHEATNGVGAGQMSRVDAVELAVKKATRDLAGSVLASDAFFPFRDGLDAAAAAGVRAVVQPGGSRRDEEVIAAANEHGIAMVFTGNRHFRH
jgi:phosphoribosylaminoimidazolecarboxamide formyltransferase/IMP cyclohydrolase